MQPFSGIGRLFIPLLLLVFVGCLMDMGHACKAQVAGPRQPSAPQLVLQRGFSGMAEALAFHPDGAMLAARGPHGTIKLWNLKTGELAFDFPAQGEPKAFDFSRDGKVFTTVWQDGKTILRDITTGSVLRVLDNGQSTNALTFSPDGKTLALCTSDQSITLWNYRTGKPGRAFRVHVGMDHWLEAKLAFSSDGALLLCGSGGLVEVWDVNSGMLRDTLKCKGGVHSLAFSPDGKTLAIGSNDWLGDAGPTIELWDLNQKAVVQKLAGHRFQVVSLAFSKNGKTLGSGDAQGILKYWDVASGVAQRSMGEKDFLIATAVSPDGRWGAEPDRNGSIRVYDLATGAVARTLIGEPQELQDATFSADGKTIITAAYIPVPQQEYWIANAQPTHSQLVLWDTRAGSWKGSVRGKGGADTLSPYPTGDTVVTGGREGTVGVWDRATLKQRSVFSEPDRRILTVAAAPDGKAITIGGDFQNAIRQANVRNDPQSPTKPSLLDLLDIHTGNRQRTFDGAKSLVNAISYSADGRLLMSVSYDATLRLWDTRTGKIQQRINLGSSHAADSATLSRDGRLVVVGYEYAPVAVFDMKTGRAVRSFPLPDQITYTVAISHDNALVAAGDYDGIVRVWNRRTGQKREMGSPSDGTLRRVVFSPDGKTLLSLDTLGNLRLWQTRTGKLIATFVLLGDTEWIVYTPEGYYEGSDGVDNFVRWRVGNTLYSASRFRSRRHRPDLVQTALSGRPQGALFAQLRGQDLHRQLEALGMMQPLGTETKPPPPKPLVPETPSAVLQRALRGAVNESVAERVRAQLAAGADINTTGRYGTTPLMFFSELGNVQEVQSLLRQQAKINLKDVYGKTALHYAARKEKTEIMQILLDAGAELTDETGASLLPLKGDPTALGTRLLKMLIPKLIPGPTTYRHYYDAAMETGVVLLYLGADPNVRDAEGNTPLLVLNSRFSPLYRLLLERGADVNAVNKDGESPLTLAGRNGDITAVRLLLPRGAEVNRQAKSGSTALTYAADRGSVETVKLLLENKADPDAGIARNGDGSTPLILAVSEGHVEVVRLLLEKGAQVNITEKYDGWTAFTYAVNRLDSTVVQLLLQHGADATLRTREGKGLLTILRENDPTDKFGIASLLKQAGATE